MSALIQQTDEWLDVRKSHIGSSDAPVLMGVSPWKTPYQLWLEKLSLATTHKTDAMQRGIDLEDKARIQFEQLTGLFVVPKVVFHSEYPWMMASLDGMDIEEKHIVEIKCPGKDDHETALQGKIPDKYYPQLQHQLEVCGLDMAYYFSYYREDGVIIEINRDDKYIDEMIKVESDFWHCMQDFIPPQMHDRDYCQKNDDVWRATATEWASINKSLKRLESKEKALREMLISMASNKNCMGAGVRVSKSLRKGNIDYSLIPQIQDVDLENYRKMPVECWKITEMN